MNSRYQDEQCTIGNTISVCIVPTCYHRNKGKVKIYNYTVFLRSDAKATIFFAVHFSAATV